MKEYKLGNLFQLVKEHKNKKGWTWTELTARCNAKAGKTIFYKEIWNRIDADLKLSYDHIIAIQEVTKIKFLG
jgi:hypothetical protein